MHELSAFRKIYIEPTALCVGLEIHTRDTGEPSDHLLEVLNIALQIPQFYHVWGHFTSIARL